MTEILHIPHTQRESLSRCESRVPGSAVLRGGGTQSVFSPVAVVLSLLLSDVLVGLGAWTVVLAFEATWPALFPGDELTLGLALGLLAVWIILRSLLGLYPGYGTDPAQELRLQTYSSFAACTVVFFSVAAVLSIGISLLLLVVALSLVFLAPFARYGAKTVLMRSGLWGKPVVVVGGGQGALRLAQAMMGDRAQDFKPVAVFSGYQENTPNTQYSANGLDTPANFRADTAVLAVEGLSSAELDGIADWASTKFKRVIAVSNLTGLSSSAVAARDMSGTLGVEVKHNLLDPWALQVKRVIDLAGALVGGVLISPILVTIAALVWLETRGSVFYADKRMGIGGKRFSPIKFRTMVPNAEEVLEKLLEEDPAARTEYAIYHKLHDDPRVTWIGRFLRETSLDELPQLWNVLKGEMSLVGPRPYLPREREGIGTAEKVILRAPPGISGLWQVSGRNGLSFEDRVEIDRAYIRNWSVWLDVLILFRTVTCVVLRRGAS